MIMTMTTMMIITITTMTTMMTNLHKQVGGYLIPYNLQLACVRKWRLSDQMRAHCCVDRSELEYHESLTQSLTRVGEELSVRAAKNGLSQL